MLHKYLVLVVSNIALTSLHLSAAPAHSKMLPTGVSIEQAEFNRYSPENLAHQFERAIDPDTPTSEQKRIGKLLAHLPKPKESAVLAVLAQQVDPAILSQGFQAIGAAKASGQ